jgi:hypothetical protein
VITLPTTQLQLRNTDEGQQVFDIVRKKYVFFTPEEFVRQQLIHYLVNDRKFPKSLLAIEKRLTLNTMTRRADVVAYDTEGKPFLIAECKSPEVPVTQRTFGQAANYNMALRVRYLVITNGNHTYCCKIDFEHERYEFVEEIPSWEMLNDGL